MKINKIVTYLYIVIIFYNVSINAKRYTGYINNISTTYKTPNVLDIGIFLQSTKDLSEEHILKVIKSRELLLKIKHENPTSDEEFIAKRGGLSGKIKDITLGAITRGVVFSVLQREAAIVSAPLIRALLDLSRYQIPKKRQTELKPIALKGINTLSKILDGTWFIYKTTDSEFALLIPKEKYPNAIDQKILNLEKIGLSQATLQPIKPIKPDLKAAFKSDLQQKNGQIKLNTLKNIFSQTPNAKKINKRIFLHGHGHFKAPQTPAIIAQLTVQAYVNLLQFLKEINCSFLSVESCFVSGLNIQNAMRNFRKQIQQRISSSQKDPLPFILVTFGMPDTPSKVNPNLFGIFFEKLNRFFQNQRIILTNTILANKKSYLTTKDKKEIIKKIKHISEQDILTGTTLKNIKKIDNITIKSLIKRNPKIIQQFSPILRYIGGSYQFNFPFIKFPGARRYYPATKVLKAFDVKKLLIDHTFLKKHKGDPILNLEKKGYVDILIESPSILKPLRIYAPIIFPSISSIRSDNLIHYMHEVIVDLRYRLANRLPIIFTKFQPIASIDPKVFFIRKLTLKNALDERKSFKKHPRGASLKDADLVEQDITLEKVFIIRDSSLQPSQYRIIFNLKGNWYTGSIRKEGEHPYAIQAQQKKNLTFSKVTPNDLRRIIAITNTKGQTITLFSVKGKKYNLYDSLGFNFNITDKMSKTQSNIKIGEQSLFITIKASPILIPIIVNNTFFPFIYTQAAKGLTSYIDHIIVNFKGKSFQRYTTPLPKILSSIFRNFKIPPETNLFIRTLVLHNLRDKKRDIVLQNIAISKNKSKTTIVIYQHKNAYYKKAYSQQYEQERLIFSEQLPENHEDIRSIKKGFLMAQELVKKTKRKQRIEEKKK